MGEDNLPSPNLALSSSTNSSLTTGVNFHFPIPSSPAFPSPSAEGDLLKLSSNIESLLSADADDLFSDVVIHVSGQGVPLHKCILAARCAFFKDLFSKKSVELSSFAPNAKSKEGSLKLQIDLQRLLDSFASGGAGQVGFEAFALTVSFLYSGKQIIPAIKCMDQNCLHDACWPAVKFGIEMLCLTSVFEIFDLKRLWQHQLHNMVEKAQIEEIFPVLVAAKIHGPSSLVQLGKQLLAVSALDRCDLEKRLPSALVDEILQIRGEMGTLQPKNTNSILEKEVQRIRKALDSDDVELVQLLLKEKKVSLDDAHALHYAASYCDPHTVQELLELELADVNLRDNRGLTVLHIASVRREPTILVALLSKGANPTDLTPDGRSALQLCTRRISCFNNSSHVETSDELQKDRLSVEVLDQASRQNPFANVVFAPVSNEKELLMRLLYLENRVAVARLLFPQEAKLVTGISQLEATSEFTGMRVSDFSGQPQKAADVDLNQMPVSHMSSNEPELNGLSLSKPVFNSSLLKRVQALQRTVELAKRIFPRCTSIVNSFMDDDISELSCIEMGSPEEQKTKRRRYDELKDILAEAFRKDVAAMDRLKVEKSYVPKSSSSSSSS